MSIRIKERCSTGECTENDLNSKELYYRAECVKWVNNYLGNTEKGDVNATLGWIGGLVVTQGTTGSDIKTEEALNVTCTEVLSITIFTSFVIQEVQRSAAFENREIEKSFVCFLHQKINVFLSHRSYLPLLQESHAGSNPSRWKPLGPTLNGIEPSPPTPLCPHYTRSRDGAQPRGAETEVFTYLFSDWVQPTVSHKLSVPATWHPHL